MFAEVSLHKIQSSAVGSSNLVRTVAPSEAERAVAVVMMGFSTDPVARWMYPDANQYFTHFPDFIRAFAGKAFAGESAYYTENFTGVALWLSPGAEPDSERLVSLIQNTVSANLQENMFAFFEQMGAYHPQEPHWYLPMIGVDTCQQNKGYGAALMRHALEQCDAEGLPAYLESSNPRNISLYNRFGFEIVGTIQVGSSPPMFPMLRKPR
jgi:ribosomal protein S18 acetylase RimI-like enzyme